MMTLSWKMTKFIDEHEDEVRAALRGNMESRRESRPSRAEVEKALDEYRRTIIHYWRSEEVSATEWRVLAARARLLALIFGPEEPHRG